MNDIEEKIMRELNKVLDDHIEAINVKVFGLKDRKSVQVLIESENGITVDLCADVTRMAQNIIKLDKIIDNDYNIEVSSPGINRPLFKMKDFIKYQGEKAYIELKRNINNEKPFTGIYEVINEKIIFSYQKEKIELSIDDIKKALYLNREIKV